MGVGLRFFVGNDGDTADVYGEEDVSEANILLSEGNMLSAGARTLGARIYISQSNFKHNSRMPCALILNEFDKS